MECLLLQVGLSAYAIEQAALQQGQTARFIDLWNTGPTSVRFSEDDRCEADIEACVQFSTSDNGSDNDNGRVGEKDSDINDD